MFEANGIDSNLVKQVCGNTSICHSTTVMFAIQPKPVSNVRENWFLEQGQRLYTCIRVSLTNQPYHFLMNLPPKNNQIESRYLKNYSTLD